MPNLRLASSWNRRHEGRAERLRLGLDRVTWDAAKAPVHQPAASLVPASKRSFWPTRLAADSYAAPRGVAEQRLDRQYSRWRNASISISRSTIAGAGRPTDAVGRIGAGQLRHSTGRQIEADQVIQRVGGRDRPRPASESTSGGSTGIASVTTACSGDGVEDDTADRVSFLGPARRALPRCQLIASPSRSGSPVARISAGIVSQRGRR